ncbi:MAG: BadF/BadG/BcrA/BcrD ATPase family protein [Sulfolobales archaeon]
MDSGASKIEFAILDYALGEMEFVELRKSGNPAAIGIERFCDNLSEIFRQILLRIDPRDIIGIGIGLAGYLEGYWDRDIIRCLSKVSGIDLSNRIFIFEDIISAHASAHLLRDGVVGILGTGSNFLGICRERIWRVGGWGHLLDDRGGAYRIASEALSRVVKSLDGRIRDTLLTSYAFKHYNANNIHDLVSRIYSSSDPKSLIASFAPYVFKAYREGDEIAREVIELETNEVALAIATIYRRLECMDIPLALVGSVYRENRDILKSIIERRLREIYGLDKSINDSLIKDSCASILIAGSKKGLPIDHLRGILIRRCR